MPVSFWRPLASKASGPSRMPKSLSLATAMVDGSRTATPSILVGAFGTAAVTSSSGDLASGVTPAGVACSRLGVCAGSSSSPPRMFVAPDSRTR